MELLVYPNEHLFKPTSRVTDIALEVKPFVKQMFKIMKKNRGIGLAANQAGLSHSFFIMRKKDADAIAALNGKIKDSEWVCINPRIIERDSLIKFKEGCLSIPYEWFYTERYSFVTLEYTTIEGEVVTEEFSDILAICVQHECDHLNGIMLRDK